MKQKIPIILAGTTVGIAAIGLMQAGNPANMGICIACFLRDIAGSLGLHQAAVVQYMRPEILGIVIGAFAVALIRREFRPVGGSSAMARFLLGFLAMIGFLVFLGCPLRMTIRLAAGDLNAVVGLVGLAAGVGAGVGFIKNGFSLGRATPRSAVNGYLFPGIFIGLTILFLAGASFIVASEKGPGAMHAPVFLSLAAGLIIGGLAQYSRLCLVGGIRDFLFFRDTYLLTGLGVIFTVALIGNIAVGAFNVGFEAPIAHNDGLWNFLGMALAGLCSTLAGGCPLRQLVASAEGNTDAAVTVMGLLAGAAMAHNWKLAASPAGVPVNGQIAVILGLLIVVGFALATITSKATTQRGVVDERASS
ncbi:MAG: YedE-related selenium metabolism membrane protein [Peptococcaceae bacterium]|nr:YedE-related selenium metabolism membrane protein [Peptococcaceae bacterium]